MTPTVYISLDRLGSADSHAALHEMRAIGPVAWLPELGGWLVTGRDQAVAALRDDARLTVDDERFSTAVVVGTSMLSTDGDDHARHRAPFAAPFTGAAVRSNHSAAVTALADNLARSLATAGAADLRTEFAGPLAVSVIVDALGFGAVDHAEVLRWYRSIVAGVDQVSAGRAISDTTLLGVAELRSAVDDARNREGSLVAAVSDELTDDELFANVAVLMFGAIETSEGMTANALWHVLTVPGLLELVTSQRDLIPAAIEESLRLEPAATVVDRYATTDLDLGGAHISRGDFVRISLAGANRDPAVFADPDRFDSTRHNARQHLAFVQGPHVCLGLHLARAQTAAAINAVLDHFTDLQLNREASSEPAGLIFRKPDRIIARWRCC